jgi:hypothetical protein
VHARWAWVPIIWAIRRNPGLHRWVGTGAIVCRGSAEQAVGEVSHARSAPGVQGPLTAIAWHAVAHHCTTQYVHAREQTGSFRDWRHRAFVLGDSDRSRIDAYDPRLWNWLCSATLRSRGSLGHTDPSGRCHATSDRTWNQDQPRIATAEICPAGLAMIQAGQAELILAKYRFLRYVHPTKPWMKPV